MPSDDTPSADTREELFGLPVGEFIAARDTLVRRLKADGAREDAAAVKALRRPTLAAWAVNHVVRADPEAGDRLVTTAHDMERAQRRALSGVRDGSLREASAARRHLVEELVDRAAAVLVAAGAAPASHLDDVGRTFEAASTSPEVAARVAEGCLSASIHPQADFTAVAGLATVAPAPPPDADNADHSDDGDGDADPELVARRRAAIRELETATTRAEASADHARAARQEATTLAERAKVARRAADDAQRIAEEARQTAERAAAEAEDVQARSDQATSAATSAEARAQADADEAERARSALDDLG